jgi:sterol 14alpha-demethylase
MDALWSTVTSSWVNVILTLALATGFPLYSYAKRSSRNSQNRYPPFYYEFPYIPWLGSLVQFATQPRDFLQRARHYCDSDVFTIQLFGKQMTFLMGRKGHAHFFRTSEQVFDIRQAYAMTVTTFGPGVCYDVPQKRMAEQFAFFKNGLSDQAFVQYMELVQDEVERYFTKEWGEAGEADLLQSLSNLFTLTSSRCLLGEEIRKRWDEAGMAEHYRKYKTHSSM